MATNISALTATEMGTLPFEITQNAGAVATDLWFTGVAAPDDQVWSIIGWSDDFGDYEPNVSFWQGHAVAPVRTPTWDARDENAGHVMNLPVTPGERYFIQVQNLSAVNPPTEDLVLSVISSAQLQRGSSAGYALIPPDEEDALAAILDPVSGAVVGFIEGVPAGEKGASLPNGAMLLEDKINNNAQVWLYDTRLGFQYLRTIDAAIYDASSTDQISSNNVDRFYVANGTLVTALSPLGETIDSWTLGASNVIALAATADNTILYYVALATNDIVRRWDLVNDVTLGAFAQYGANFYAKGDLFVLDDQTVLVWWENDNGTDPDISVRYAADGSVIRVFTLE